MFEFETGKPVQEVPAVLGRQQPLSVPSASSPSSPSSPSSLPVARRGKPGKWWPLEEEEGQRLAHAMSTQGLASLKRWCEAWEPQIHSGACAAASAMGALRFLGLAGSWSQRKIFDKVLYPYGLITAGVSFTNGAQMLQLLGAQMLEVTQHCSKDKSAVEIQLREDLSAAFAGDCNFCILVNYWRPLCPLGFSGGGHWSPLGGISEDHVLILDTNSNSHPPHWACLSDLVGAMCEHNPTTQLPRGYVTLRRYQR